MTATREMERAEIERWKERKKRVKREKNIAKKRGGESEKKNIFLPLKSLHHNTASKYKVFKVPKKKNKKKTKEKKNFFLQKKFSLASRNVAKSLCHSDELLPLILSAKK